MKALLAALTGLAAALVVFVVPASADPGPVTPADVAAADGCYTWNRTLSEGSSGEDVRQLQIRVAGYPGYPGYGGVLAQQARDHGFAEILGPGYPGHDDHTHVAARSGQFWSAPSCGI